MNNSLQVEKENPNLITVFICFLRSGLRFTRYDTNNVGLAFIEEIKRHNANFKPVKVQQRERDQIYTVNAYPKEFEQLILSLIEEYRKKHKLEYRLKKPRTGRSSGAYNRGGGSRQGGYANRDQQGSGSYSRPRRDEHGGGYSQRRESEGSREGSYRPRRNNDDQQGQGSYRQRENLNQSRSQREDGNRPVREPGYRDSGNDKTEDHSPSRNTKDRNDSSDERRIRRPRRPRKDVDE